MLSGSLAAIGFLSPWMAWGAVAAVGLPILAHLLSKTRYREVVFPAARLVQRAVAATSRIETPRDRLLMLLRLLALLLLVLAFMRPQWTPNAQASNTDRGIALVLLVDASASMQRTDQGATLYDRALREAERLIGQLDPSRDVAMVYLVDHSPAPLLPEPTAQMNLLKERLSATLPGYSSANWAAAVSDAQRQLADEIRAVRVVTISDQQGTQPDLSFISYGKHDAAIDQVRLDGPTDNTAIRLVDVRPYPPLQGQPITLSIEVNHFGEQASTAALTARFLGSENTQTLELEPGSTQRVEFRLPTQTADAGLLQITLNSADAIVSDNTAGVWLAALQQPRVIVVHDANAISLRLARRIATVLNPGELAGQSVPVVEAVPVESLASVLDGANPADLRTVILLNQTPLSDGASKLLEAYAQAGGGVIEFVSNQGAAARRTVAANIDFDLEPLRIFQGPARAGLATLPWSGVSNAPIDERAGVILQDEQERVIVAEMLRGRGRLIAINAALPAKTGGLLAEPSFVVLFNELCKYASPGPALPAPLHPGDVMPLSLREAVKRRVPQGADTDAEVFTAPGPYAEITPSGENKDVVYVSLDPGESDTRPTPPWSDINATTKPDQAAVSDASETAAPLIRDSPIDLWPYVVLCVLGLVAFESLLLLRFSCASRPKLLEDAA